MKSCELVTFITAVACNMASCYSEEELSMLSVIFSQLGDTLATIIANESFISSSQECAEEKECNCKEENTKDEKVEKDQSKIKKDCDSEDISQ